MEFKLKDDILTINGEVYKLVPVEEQQVQEKARTGWERVEEGDEFFYVHCHCTAADMFDYKTSGYNEMYEKGNYTNDEQLCNNIGRAFSLYLRMLRWQAENDVPVDVHNPDVTKWYIRYDMATKELHSNSGKICFGAFDIYFSTAEKARECIRAFESDLLWLHTEFYRRLDERGVDNAEMQNMR